MSHADRADPTADPSVRALIAALRSRASDRHELAALLAELLGGRGLHDLAVRWHAARLLLDGEMPFVVAQVTGSTPEEVAELAQRLRGPRGTGAVAEIAGRLATNPPAQPPEVPAPHVPPHAAADPEG
jgi:hypothetical protein